MSLSERLQKIRKEFNLTQQQLADIVKSPRQRITDMEIGKVKNIKGHEIEALEKEYKLNPLWITTGNGSMYNCNHGTVVGVNNGNISVNTSDFNHSTDIKEIIELLHFAPPAYLAKLKKKLEEYKYFFDNDEI